MTQYQDAPVFDRESVLEMVDGEVEFVQELVELFLADLPTQLETLRNGIENNDAETVQYTGHRLKGSIGNLGGRRAQYAIRDLEQQARQGDLTGIAELFAQCEIELQAFEQELNRFMTEPVC
jgi:HPt (histidine-containing phosphotransfer) domain-containing protein